jgi:hypothetical protein
LHLGEIKFQAIREILLLGHRQAFAWIDEWFDMTLEQVREYEKKLNDETNKKVWEGQPDDEVQEAQEAKEFTEDVAPKNIADID